MVNPCPGFPVTTPYGQPGGWAAGYHTGADYAAPSGTPVVAAAAGVVVAEGWNDDYGNYVEVETSGVRHRYCHLVAPGLATNGMQVGAGQMLGHVGSTGNSTGPHLHYEERVSPWGYWDHREPQLNGDGATGGGWTLPPGQKVYGKYLKWHGHEQNSDGRSDSIRAWQEMLNAHSIPGGEELPVTGQWFEMTADETRLCQRHHVPPEDPYPEGVFVGSQQFEHVRHDTGCPYVWVA